LIEFRPFVPRPLSILVQQMTNLVTARTKCYSMEDEGSSVDCTIEDTKLEKKGEERKEHSIYTSGL